MSDNFFFKLKLTFTDLMIEKPQLVLDLIPHSVKKDLWKCEFLWYSSAGDD
jgi:hypothetical protein